MLTSIQTKVAEIINNVDDRESFVLAGGAALIFRKISNRETEDLDYFTREQNLVNKFAKKCKLSLQNETYIVEVEIENIGFCRLRVTKSNRKTLVDFGQDYFRNSDSSELGPTLSLVELGANKILATAGRSLSRDGFDLYSLCKNSDIQIFIDRAPEIDPGFTVNQLVRGLQGLKRFSFADSGFTNEEWERVLLWADSTCKELAAD